ncbi:RNA-binding protein [Staphylococcus muscae]|uniref:RNA-binding S4 domain-containing protein n=1 Tax=Staphylococcus muscae TaxID=1294 RepID=A0A240C3H7_9STAP|nr:RNA-binding protein [Staphylococcus muscae]GGA81137.1 S4 RNA-binding protein [Staphylococcus muscae]SNW01658.1 RNA-binding S4 domain-containing protein [Staphylococcus muscae]
MSKIDIYQHFRTEERPIIDNLLDKVRTASQQYAPILTYFLDPRSQYILEVIVGSFPDMTVHFNGGPNAERCRAVIAPDYYVPEEADYELTVIEVDYPEKFVTLEHRHILGTIMSLGIEREQVGDIIVGDRIQFVLTNQLESYIMMELRKIKGATVKLHIVSLQDMVQSKAYWQTVDATVSALRLDVVLKEMVHKSRTIAKELIQRKRVKVNHTVIEAVDYQLEQGDLLSIQGFGRARITAIGDRTKKDKLRITYQTLFK